MFQKSLKFPQVRSLIDYGDAIYTQTINDVAICCAYAIMDIPDPLEAALPIVRGYHKSFPLQEQELEFLYSLIAVRLIISVTKAAINKIETPANEYLWISENQLGNSFTNGQILAQNLLIISFVKPAILSRTQ